MKRREYLFGFVLILVGLSIGFSISQGAGSTPWHVLQNVYTSPTGVSVDAGGTPGYIDNADNAQTVTSIGPNIVGGYALHNLLAPIPPQPAYNVFTLFPLGAVPNIPTTAKWVILEYELVSGGAACVTANLEFTDDPAVHPWGGTIVHVSHSDAAGVSGRHDQVWVPIAKNNPGKFWMKYYYSQPAGPCGYALYMVAYVN